MKAGVAAFNQEKALVGAFSVITNLRMDIFEALEREEGDAAVPDDEHAAGGRGDEPEPVPVLHVQRIRVPPAQHLQQYNFKPKFH